MLENLVLHFLEVARVVIHLSFSGFAVTRWYEYAMRFALGGIATVAIEIIGNQFGPMIGALFLAIPSIFCASASLIKKHETKKNKWRGLPAGQRVRHVVALDTLGTTLGGIGLSAFALVVWCLLKAHGLTVTLSSATIIWALASVHHMHNMSID